MNIRVVLSFVMIAAFISGCAVVAAPCRITGAVVQIIPVIGDPIGEALEACGDAID
ncbi:MAG: DUF6726 family protein [Rhodospirillales bacterium]